MNKALVVNFSPDDGSGMGKTADRIRSFVGSDVIAEEGKRVGGDIPESDLQLWLQGIV
ncbi:MAG: hypothetical protein IKE16_02730 [Solobacterium sp.]|nr:hypothetical protein [Solobacterium sp.]MBR2793535.1 hypothetical protein [Solobacterium sp.]